MDKFKEYNLNLNKKNKDLIKNYLKEIKDFIEKKSIDEELYNDIEERVFDKLKEEKNLNQLNIVKILKEVWEANDIFSDYIDEEPQKKEKKTSKKRKYFYEWLIESWWTRSNKDAVFLGLSWLIAKKTWISSIWFIRIVLLILIYPLWFSAWIYFIAWIFIPLENHDYKNKNELSYLWTNILTSFLNIFSNFFSFISKPLQNFWIFTYRWWVSLIWIIFSLFLYIFLLFWIATIFSIIISLIVLLSWYFTEFSVWNIDFFSTFPNYFMYGLIFGIISLIIFLAWLINYMFTKKSINAYILSFWFVSFFIALFLWISTWFNLIEKYSNKSFIEKNIEHKLTQINTWTLNIDLSWFYNDDYIQINWYWLYDIRLENSSWDILKAKQNIHILWNDEIVKKVSSWMNDVKIKNEWNKVVFYTENWKTFKNKVPFTFLKNNITLYIPEWYKIEFKNRYWTNINNVSVVKEELKYSESYNNCFNSIIYFSKEENKFVCKLNEEDLKQWKKSYLTNYIIKNIHDISPILHNDEYKREYHNYFYLEENFTDWDFIDFNWSEDWKNITFIYWDMSLEIKANLDIEESWTWVLVSNFQIKDIKINQDIYKEKYYKDPKIINDLRKY